MYNQSCCNSYPAQNGQNGHNYFEIDAKTFAEWGIDSFKCDGCNQDPKTFDDLYPKMGQALNKSGQLNLHQYLNRKWTWSLCQTGRTILYSCEWPMYQFYKKIEPNYDAIAKNCHIFRNYGDVQDSWGSVSSIIDYYAKYNDLFMKHNGKLVKNFMNMLITILFYIRTWPLLWSR